MTARRGLAFLAVLLVTAALLHADLSFNQGGGVSSSSFTGGTVPNPTVFQSAIYYFSGVEAVTSTKTPDGANEGNETYTNTGDTDGATVTLPNDPVAGWTYHFAVTTAQRLTIVASAGESLQFGTDTCALSLSSNDIGATVTLRAVTGGSGAMWMAFGTQFGTGGQDLWDCFD